jgi:hypothetical protein
MPTIRQIDSRSSMRPRRLRTSKSMIASFVLVDAAIISQPRFRTLPSLPQIDVVNNLFRRDRKLWRRLRDKLRVEQPHGFVTQCRPSAWS